MDEYLFILLSKLKADRLKLQREQREAVAAQQDLFEESREPAKHPSAKARRSLPGGDWSTGLRRVS